ncbi:HAD-like domain-containing protein [Entophlyctis helioformis]|nr:HAD-like domain-containing protein [Entophlyctis helioformis]
MAVDATTTTTTTTAATTTSDAAAGKPLQPLSAVVVDIEGTTTPISFVHDVLFPYVSASVAAFLDERWADAECQERVSALRLQADKDIADGVDGAVAVMSFPDGGDAEAAASVVADVKASVVANIKWQMSIDRKIGALKAFQGYLWRYAYENGKVKGDVFDDVVVALNEWKALGLPVYIYSSGSVEAQKLLFKYSEHGDLLPHFKGHFDTAIGPKTEAASYEAIVREIGVPAGRVLFLSDNVKEVQAAASVGYQVRIAVREGNAAVADEQLAEFGSLASFAGLGLVAYADKADKADKAAEHGADEHAAKRARVEA